MPFNPAILKSNTLSWIENTETVTVTRRTPNGATMTVSTIYTGLGDVQLNPGGFSYDPAGPVVEIDAICLIDAVAGVLPAIKNGDFLQVTGGDLYTVFTVEPWSLQPAHVELKLKRGTANYAAGGHR